ncbi:MAG: GlsB/YeaQ/YmgE family stress response membrane protein [Polyangiaceae bacterium]|nr:GlsB/YeaQ/YmgE family stress response membrane protein [Polyangiaceae bacterium]
MAILMFLLFGLVVGLLARAVLPGEQRMGLLMTMGLGVAGSFVGGLLTSLVTRHRITELNTAGLLASIVGAVALLFIAGALARRRAYV